MKFVITNIFWGSVFIALLMLTGYAGSAQKVAAPKVPQNWKFTFPTGDQQSGKAVFLNMQCYTCHVVKLPRESLAAPMGKDGPELTGYSALPKEYLAESIIKAHTIVAAPGYTVKEGKAAMGNYNHFLTIQELIDLVAFLKEGTKTGGK
jgi:hypothetical protein